MHVYTFVFYILQAVYRGYWVRCKLREVIQEAKYESEEDSSLEEDIDLNWRKDVRKLQYQSANCVFTLPKCNF